MKYIGKAGECILIANITLANVHLLNEHISERLCLYWNVAGDTEIIIDGETLILHHNQIIFLTQFHKVDQKNVETLRYVCFNRAFYCILTHDTEVGCNGLLFMCASNIPSIIIPDTENEKYELLWKVFCMEMGSTDNMQLEMLQLLLKRFLILSTRLYKEQQQITNIKPERLDIVREYNYLVEMHFRNMHTVAEYAGMLSKSPKVIATLFKDLSSKTPLQIIQDRRMLEARRLLIYTNKTIKEIAYELMFEDVQTFSRFFKNQEKVNPSHYRSGKY